MTETAIKTYRCFCCGLVFETPVKLAQHINEECIKKKTYSAKLHAKSRIWAAKVLAGNTLRPKVDFKHISDDPDKERTEYGNENRENARVQLSGKVKNTLCFCPKCKRPNQQSLPIEFLRLDHLWTFKTMPVIFCDNCRR